MIFKRIFDIAFNWLKNIEENLDDNIACLNGIKRSVQLDKYSCGAQSASVILDYFDKTKPIDKVKQLLGTTKKDGTDTDPILNLFKQNNLNVDVNEKAELNDIYESVDEGNPILISVYDGEHWIVVYGYSDDSIYVLDPSIKQYSCRLSKNEFNERWDENWIAVISSNRL